jgi:hypothetical protein
MQLQTLLNPSLLIEVKKDSIRLYEKENDEKKDLLTEVIINELPKNIIAYSRDIEAKQSVGKSRKMYNEFLNNDLEDIHKRSDGVIIEQKSDDLIVIICDLKSTNYSQKDCASKFLADTLFLKYLLSILRDFHAIQNDISTIKYIIFYYDRLYKPTVRYQKFNGVDFDYEKVKHLPLNDEMFAIPLEKTHRNYLLWDDLLKLS